MEKRNLQELLDLLTGERSRLITESELIEWNKILQYAHEVEMIAKVGKHSIETSKTLEGKIDGARKTVCQVRNREKKRDLDITVSTSSKKKRILEVESEIDSLMPWLSVPRETIISYLISVLNRDTGKEWESALVEKIDKELLVDKNLVLDKKPLYQRVVRMKEDHTYSFSIVDLGSIKEELEQEIHNVQLLSKHTDNNGKTDYRVHPLITSTLSTIIFQLLDNHMEKGTWDYSELINNNIAENQSTFVKEINSK